MLSVGCYMLILHYCQETVSICLIVATKINIQIRFLVLLTQLIKYWEKMSKIDKYFKCSSLKSIFEVFLSHKENHCNFMFNGTCLSGSASVSGKDQEFKLRIKWTLWLNWFHSAGEGSFVSEVYFQLLFSKYEWSRIKQVLRGKEQAHLYDFF